MASTRVPDAKERSWIAIFSTALIVGMLVVIYCVGLVNGRQAERREHTVHEHVAAAKERARAECKSVDVATEFDCVLDRVATSQEQAHDEQDLTAQQRAAWGALLAAFTALLSVPFSFIGMFLLYRTLIETRRTLAEAQIANQLSYEGMNRELRAYVGVTEVVATLSRVGKRREILFEVAIRNSGQTPGYITHDKFTAVSRLGGEALAESVQESTTERVIGPQSTIVHPIALVFDSDDYPTEVSCHLSVLLHYRDYRGGEDWEHSQWMVAEVNLQTAMIRGKRQRSLVALSHVDSAVLSLIRGRGPMAQAYSSRNEPEPAAKSPLRQQSH